MAVDTTLAYCKLNTTTIYSVCLAARDAANQYWGGSYGDPDELFPMYRQGERGQWARYAFSVGAENEANTNMWINAAMLGAALSIPIPEEIIPLESNISLTTEDAVSQATKNPDSSVVVLGKHTGENNPTSYQNVAKRMDATYFQLSTEDWNQLVKQGTGWEVNKEFLQEQVSQGKTFVLTVAPEEATGAYGDELEFLSRQGYRFVYDGQYWKAVK